MGGVTWEPGEEGEVLSDYEEGSEPFETSSHGFYSLGSPKEVKDQGYAERGAIMGAIKPYGRVVHGERGFRSTKARVDALFKSSAPCFVCGKSGTVVIIEEEKEHVVLCNSCRKRLKKLIDRLGPEKVKEYSLDDLLNRLAIIYEAQVVDYPKELEEE
jgi:transcription elongation factor Elf1